MVELLAGAIALGMATLSSSPATSDQFEYTTAANTLALVVDDPADTCVTPGTLISVRMALEGLDEDIVGFQAFLEFDPDLLEFLHGGYDPTSPFLLEFVSPIAALKGNIDLAAGAITPFGGSDADLAEINFRAATREEMTFVRFRFSDPATTFARVGGGSLDPSLVKTVPIVVTSDDSDSDSDGDGVRDPCDRCPCADDAVDTDQDGIPDDCDRFADYDHDGNLTTSDFRKLNECLAGPISSSHPACSMFVYDEDEDVDLAEFAMFQNHYGATTCD